MSAQDNSGAAYPCVTEDYLQEGMTKREAFAMAAMQGYCANADVNATPEAVAGWAVHQADFLLAELEKGGES